MLAKEVGVCGVTRCLRKVCFISPLGYGLYNPATAYPFGGAEVQFFLLAQQLAQDVQFEVSVLTTVREESGCELYGPLRVFKRKSRGRLTLPLRVTVVNVVKTIAGFAQAFLSMARQLRQIGADVYLHAGAGVEVGAYAVLCRLMRKRFIFVVASSADLSAPQGLVTGPLKWLFPLGVRLAHSIVCRTEDQQRLLRGRYKRSGVLIRTGHPSLMMRDVPKSFALWVGRGNPLKQPEIFLDLAARIPDHRFVMVVAHEDAHQNVMERLRGQAAKLGNLELHENVPWREIGPLFREARLLVNTSLYEGFPNTFVEAALSATPVISLNVDPDGVLRSRQLGVCAEGNVEKLYELVTTLLSDPARTARLGYSARSYALQHHSLDSAASHLKGLIEGLTVQPQGAL